MSDKKFDLTIINSLIDQINKAKKEGESEIKLSLKENNIIKEINPDFSVTLYGAYNGYGYPSLGKHLTKEHFEAAGEGLLMLQKSAEIKKPAAAQDPVKAWISRLVKLTDIDIETAKK